MTTHHAREILEQYKKDMVRMGIDENRIEIVTRPRSLGLAKDIIDFGQVGRYDAIVVGSRRMSRLQRVFMGSVSANLLKPSEIVLAESSSKPPRKVSLDLW